MGSIQGKERKTKKLISCFPSLLEKLISTIFNHSCNLRILSLWMSINVSGY